MSKSNKEFPSVFDPLEYGLSLPVEEIQPFKLDISVLPGDEIFVTDLRTDFSGVPKCETVQDVATHFGGTIARTELGWDNAPVGKRVFRLIGWVVRDGASAFIPKFLDVNGQPAQNIAIVHSWPSAPNLDQAVAVKPDWLTFLGYGRVGVVGLTNQNGDIGFGFGGGMVCQPSGGVGVIFPLVPTHTDDPAASDCATKLCWNGSTNHAVANPVYEEVIKTGSIPPPPSNGADTYISYIEHNGVIVARKVWNPITSTGEWKEVLFKGNEQIGEIILEVV